jgi:hypothetical protein
VRSARHSLSLSRAGVNVLCSREVLLDPGVLLLDAVCGAELREDAVSNESTHGIAQYAHGGYPG